MDKEKFKKLMSLNPMAGNPNHPYESHHIGLNFSRSWCYFNLS